MGACAGVSNRSTPIDWAALDPDSQDRAAWQVLLDWPAAAGGDCVRDGLDYAELAQWFLWDKVGRAIRCQVDPQAAVFENGPARRPSPYVFREPRAATGWTASMPLLRDPLVRLRLRHEVRGRPVLYSPAIPGENRRLREIVHALNADAHAAVVTGFFPGTCRWAFPTRDPVPDLAFAGRLHSAILRGLQALNVVLLREDADLLRVQLRDLLTDMCRTEAELRLVRPSLVLLHADNYPPPIGYAAVCRRDGIACVAFQHGMDCERYYLDEAHAAALGVWSQARAQRYQRDSRRQARVEVVGNPEFEKLRLPERVEVAGDSWLWVTRPHVSEKCYAPSRSPREGLEIFEALLDALAADSRATLVVKPHYYDYTELYRQAVAARPAGVAQRVRITDEALHSLFARACVVISEDSTAGMEAMFHGKPLVHAHFARSRPTVPFTDQGAALPGFSAGQLRDSLSRAAALGEAQRRELCEAQREFLRQQAGECGGNATRRCADFVLDMLRRSGRGCA